MIFADKLIDLRKRNGFTQEELAEKLNVSRQSVSKWEGAQSIPDLNKIIKLSEIFDVSTDYLLRDDIEKLDDSLLETTSSVSYEESSTIKVSVEEAVNFLEDREKYSKLIALGACLCIMVGAIAIMFGGLGEKMEQLSVVGILIVIAVAVALFIYSGMQLNKYEYLEKENIDTEYGITGMVKEKKEAYKNKYNLKIVIGVTLIILSSLPMILGEAYLGEDKSVNFVVITLLLIAIAVYNFITSGMQMSGYNMLLEVEDYTVKKKLFRKKNGWFAGAYWITVTAIYLAYSFMTVKWDKSWIIWPVAGVLFPAILMLLEAIFNKRDKNF